MYQLFITGIVEQSSGQSGSLVVHNEGDGSNHVRIVHFVPSGVPVNADTLSKPDSGIKYVSKLTVVKDGDVESEVRNRIKRNSRERQ